VGQGVEAIEKMGELFLHRLRMKNRPAAGVAGSGGAMWRTDYGALKFP
jgi:hypothetical protein